MLPTPRTSFLFVTFALSFCRTDATAIAQPPNADNAPRTRLDYRVSPAVDLHYYIRALAEDKKAEVPAPLQSPVEAAREINRELGSWGMLESRLNGVNSVAEIRKAFADLPEEYTPRFSRSKKTVPLRELATRYVDALASGEAHFMEHVWPGHERIVREDLARIERDFVPHFDKLLAYMLEHLDMQDPKIAVPIYLVGEAHFPGGFTMIQPGGRPIMFVQTTRIHHEGTQLFELIIHESCHALDIAGDSVFKELRDKLAAAGFSPRDDLFRDVPHTIMFAQAGETIRRLMDPNHKHYGEVATYYARTGKPGEFVPRLWIEYLDGKLTREQALDQMVKETLEVHGSD